MHFDFFDYAQYRQKGLAPILIILILAGALALAGGAYYLGTKKSEYSIPQIQQPKQTTTDVSPAPSGSAETVYTESDRSANWKTYTTNGTFGLTEEILKEYPTITKGNLKFRYPQSWQLSERKPEFSNQKKYGVFLGVSLSKEHSSYKSPGEIPAENSAFINFNVKATNLDPDQIVDRYSDEFGAGSAYDQILKQQIFNGYKAAKIIQNQPFPHVVVFSVSPSMVMNITTDFYDNNKDKEYSDTTIREINSILDSMIVIQ